MDKVISEFPKNTLEKVVVGITNFNGKDLFYLRVHFQDKEGNWHPTKKGITLSMGCWEDFEKAFEKLQEEVERLA